MEVTDFSTVSKTPTIITIVLDWESGETTLPAVQYIEGIETWGWDGMPR